MIVFSLTHQLKTDDFDWMMGSGETTTWSTGPQADHTYGTSAGHYLYTEASLTSDGNIAQLQSPLFRDRNEAKCINLWYHMYGVGVGKLEILLSESGKPRTSLWSESGG